MSLTYVRAFARRWSVRSAMRLGVAVSVELDFSNTRPSANSEGTFANLVKANYLPQLLCQLDASIARSGHPH